MVSSVITQLSSIFQQVFNDSDIVLSEQTSSNDVDGWDSLSHINLILAVENRFGIEFSRRELAGLKNVGDLIRVIENKIS